jgi:glycine/D-amino acid oxidase-like deaminating enzyme
MAASSSRGPRVVVVGAGAFGGWTALALVRRGARVTLVDAWGPGHARSSSGGETRVIRATYGTRAIYTKMAARALELWRDYERRHECRFFTKTGVLWMSGRDDSFARTSASALRAEGLPLEELTPAAAAKRYSQIDFGGIHSVLFEPEAGYLLARRACEHVAERVVAEGGRYQQAAVSALGAMSGSAVLSIALAGGGVIAADAFVFACGPWLGSVFPDVIGPRVRPTRQDIYYFGTPAGDSRFEDSACPVWLDLSIRPMYGIPGNAHRGFKVGDDTSGPVFDPTNGERDVPAEGVRAMRAFLAARFPALADAPLIGAEVCQYEATPDSDYIVDRHPRAQNVWLVGGGSGHGFKMGPAIGEMVATLVLNDGPVEPAFSLRRFEHAKTPDSQQWRTWHG